MNKDLAYWPAYSKCSINSCRPDEALKAFLDHTVPSFPQAWICLCGTWQLRCRVEFWDNMEQLRKLGVVWNIVRVGWTGLQEARWLIFPVPLENFRAGNNRRWSSPVSSSSSLLHPEKAGHIWKATCTAIYLVFAWNKLIFKFTWMYWNTLIYNKLYVKT